MKIEGVIVPLITPLNPDESLDYAGLEKLVEHVILGGVSGIFIMGSCGEGPALPDSVKERLVRAVSERAKGRVQVLVGVFGVGTRQTIELATLLTRQGGDAIVIAPPYYFPQTQNEIVSHMTAIARSQNVPTVVYNIPQMVKTIIEPETVARLAEQPGIAAIKDSVGDMARFQRILAIRQKHPGFGVYQGAEEVAALSILRGANGGVWGLANVAPRLCCALFSVARSGDLAKAWALQERMSVLGELHSHGQWLPCLKMAVSQLGICGPTAVSPFEPLNDSAIAAIRRDMGAAGVL